LEYLAMTGDQSVKRPPAKPASPLQAKPSHAPTPLTTWQHANHPTPPQIIPKFLQHHLLFSFAT
jgi:hypothetical protein